jgi:hypothetical protein
MVYPVSSGVSQQLPIANSYQQPGATNETVKRPEDEKRPDESRSRDAEAARSQASQTKDYSQSRAVDDTRARDTGGVNASSSRGTSLDITV